MKILENNIAILEEDHYICRWIQESGKLDHDQNMLPIVLRYIKKGDVVIDAGSFIGDHTIAYANKVGSTGKVFAFEPNHEAFKCLVHNMANYSYVECRSEGLSNKNSSLFIHEYPDNIGMTYLSEKGEKQIETITIDSLELKRCDFIKIDCEGHEIEVITGAHETIKKFKPKMLIEVNKMALERAGFKKEELITLVKLYGYKVQDVYGKKIEDMKNEVQFDMLCL